MSIPQTSGQSATKLSSKFTVYKITNTANGKSYIGITSRHYKVRWWEHVERARQGVRNSRLYSAIRKYGHKSFSVEPIATADTEQALRDMETEYIKKFDAYENGYNSNLGGHGFLEFPEHIRKKIGAAQKGKFIPAETRRKMSAAKQGDARCASNFGKHVLKGAENPRARKHLIQFPDGTEHEVIGLRAFCRERNLHLAHLTTRGHSKGYRLLRRLND